MQVTLNLRGVAPLIIFCPPTPLPRSAAFVGHRSTSATEGRSGYAKAKKGGRGGKTSYNNIRFPSFFEINPSTVLRFAYLF